MEDQNNNGMPSPETPQPIPQPPQMPQPPSPPQQSGMNQPPNMQPTPTPGSTNNNPTLIKNNNTRVVIMIIAGFLLVGAIGFGVSRLVTKKHSTSTNSSGIAGLGGEKTTEKSAKIGSSVDLADFEVTVGNTSQKTSIDKYTEAGPGKVYVLTSVKIKNKSKFAIDNPDYFFSLTTEKGEISKSLAVYGDTYKKMADAIAPAGESEGYIYFEISNTDKMKDITFDYQYIPTSTKEDIKVYKAIFTQ